MTLLQYELLLPDDHAMRQLAEWIKSYVGDEFAWEARLTLHMDEVPDPVMNKSTPRRLGMTSWFHSRAPRHRSDLVIRPRGTSFTFEHQSRNPHGQPRAAAPTT
jgi:type VI secretion system protein ImpH